MIKLKIHLYLYIIIVKTSVEEAKADLSDGVTVFFWIYSCLVHLPRLVKAA